MNIRTITYCTFIFLFSHAIIANGYGILAQQKKVKKTKIDTMNVKQLKPFVANELKNYADMAGGLKLLMMLFGNNLVDSRKAIDRYHKEAAPDKESLYLEGILCRFENNYELSEQKFRAVIEQDERFSGFGFPNVWMLLGDLYKSTGKLEKAIDAYKQGALMDLEDTWPLIEIAKIYIEMNRPEEASEAFYAGLTGIRDQDKHARLFSEIRDIATKKEKEKWDSLSHSAERAEFLKVFWMRRDPNPLDKENQRLVEHYRRLSYAQQTYSKPMAPYYDERGLVYINLGKPDAVYIGKSGVNIRDNETWVYNSIQAGLNIDFVNMGGSYVMRPLLDAVQNSATLPEIINMFDERSMIHPYYAKMKMKIQAQADVEKARADEAMYYADQNNIYSLLAAATMMQNSQYGYKMLGHNEYRQDNVDNELYAGGNQRFEFDFGAPHLPINFNVASFRSGAGASRLEFYYTVPFKEMVFAQHITKPGYFNSTLKLKLKVFDLKFNEIKYFESQYSVVASEKEKETLYFLDQIAFDSLQPGRYNLALEIRNNENDKVGIYQFTVNVKDYSPDSLSLSHIEIAQYVETTLSKDKYVKPKSTMRVVPNPAAGLVKTKPLTIYYEIYNLSLNNEGKTSYQVSYSIKMAESNQSFLSTISGLFSSADRSGTSTVTAKEGKSRHEKEYIAFDISELPEGIATLEVKVKDLNTQKESSSLINLTIINEDKSKQETTKKN